MTATGATARSKYGWMRTVVLTVGIALLGMTLLPSAARAEINDGRTDSAAFLAKLCKAGGGVVVIVDNPGWTVVSCSGGVYGGMECYFGPEGTFCTGAYPHPVHLDAGSQIWQIDEILPVLENGSPEQLDEILDDLEAANPGGQNVAPPADQAAPVAASGVVSPDDQQQDQNHSTGKAKGKKGKKGGKGRK